MSHPKLEQFLLEAGFSGDIPLNSRATNYHALKRLVAGDAFYTFGIKEIHRRIKTGEVDVAMARAVLVQASGRDARRFRWLGPGYFDPAKSAIALMTAMERLRLAAERHQHIAFATGHPGAMTGLLDRLARWAEALGAHVVTLEQPLPVKGAYYLDMLGNVLAVSDNASNWHTHDTVFMDALLQHHRVDLVVGDHGFIGAALNRGIACLGFYDTDDPALPVAQYLGLPIISVPLNDNRYNVYGRRLAELMIQLEKTS